MLLAFIFTSIKYPMSYNVSALLPLLDRFAIHLLFVRTLLMGYVPVLIDLYEMHSIYVIHILLSDVILSFVIFGFDTVQWEIW